jgi:Holliday junction resolvasome RuvABC DNA-binding subunit
MIPWIFNIEVADKLEEVARLLEAQGANPFRVRAYRNAADSVRQADRSVKEILDHQGMEGIRRLPGVGEGLARAIRALALMGRLGLLERLRGESDPIKLLMTVPGIGEVTARRLHEDLGIESLEELESAAHASRLSDVPGIGPKTLEGIRDALAARLGPWRQRADEAHAPTVAELLDVDREYRQKAEAGKLRTIAPRRFNPEGESWLPILHTERDSRHYTALFSNTARAHQLGRTRDWVVIYRDDDAGRGQWTVVTARSECARFYS